MSLDPSPARPYKAHEVIQILSAVLNGMANQVEAPAMEPLTSREIAQMISGILGGLLMTTTVEEVMNALRHFASHLPEYEQQYTAIKQHLTRLYQAIQEPQTPRGHA